MIDVNTAAFAAGPPRDGVSAHTVWAGNPMPGNDLRTARPPEKEGPKTLGAIGETLKFAAGQTVFWEHDDADHFFEVRDGTVSVSKRMLDGRRQILEFLSTGDLIGLTGHHTYPYTADAVTEVIAVRYRRRDLEARIGNNPSLASHLLAAMIDELRAAQDRNLLLGRKAPKEKLASFLLMMASRRVYRGAIDGHIDLPMTRRDIADYLGLTVETISRTFALLRRDGTIALLNPNQVVVLRTETLDELAEGNRHERF